MAMKFMSGKINTNMERKMSKEEFIKKCNNFERQIDMLLTDKEIREKQLAELKAENEIFKEMLKQTNCSNAEEFRDFIYSNLLTEDEKLIAIKDLQKQLKEKDNLIEFYINSGKEQCDEINRINHQTTIYCDEIDKLNKIIVKNELEIRELKSENKLLKESNKNLYQRRLINTKQVCEKIRGYIKSKETKWISGGQVKGATIPTDCVYNLLDQIEKGECN